MKMHNQMTAFTLAFDRLAPKLDQLSSSEMEHRLESNTSREAYNNPNVF